MHASATHTLHPPTLAPATERLRAEAVALLLALAVAGGGVLLAAWLRPAEPGTLLVRRS